MNKIFSGVISKTSALFFAALLFFTSCTKSRYTWNTEAEYFKVPIWKNKVKAFKKIKMAPNTAKLFIGDSITEGFDLNRHLNDSTTVNMGIGGDFTSGVLRRLDIVAALQPKQIFVMIGINDILKNVPQDRIENNYREIIAYMKKHCTNSKIYVQSNLPTTGMGGTDESNRIIVARVEELNAFLTELCAANQIEFINLYPKFETTDHKLIPELTYDGLHLSDSGYVVWSNEIRSLLQNN